MRCEKRSAWPEGSPPTRRYARSWVPLSRTRGIRLAVPAARSVHRQRRHDRCGRHLSVPTRRPAPARRGGRSRPPAGRIGRQRAPQDHIRTSECHTLNSARKMPVETPCNYSPRHRTILSRWHSETWSASSLRGSSAKRVDTHSRTRSKTPTNNARHAHDMTGTDNRRAGHESQAVGRSSDRQAGRGRGADRIRPRHPGHRTGEASARRGRCRW